MREFTVASTDDVRIYVTTNIETDGLGPDGPTVLFIHGYPDTHRTWEPQLAALQADHRVAAMDLRGAGQSTSPADPHAYAIDRVLPDLTAVIDAIARPGEKVHLVAHDWGALISWRYVSEPHLAERIASYTTMAGVHPDLALAMVRQRLRSGKGADLAAALHQWRLSWYVVAFQVPGLGEWRWRLNPQGFWAAVHRQGGVPAGDPILSASTEEVLSAVLAPLNYYRMLGRHWASGKLKLPAEPIQVPINVLITDRDMALSPWLYDNVPEYAANAELHHLEANHWVNHSHPELVNAMVREFIAKHAG